MQGAGSVSEIASAIFGCGIGLISGVMLDLIIHDARPRKGALSYYEKAFGRRNPSTLKLAAKAAGIPSLWLLGWTFAEPWDSYWIGLGVVFGLVVEGPVLRLINRVGRGA